MSAQELIELIGRVASFGFTITAKASCFIVADGLSEVEIDAQDLPRAPHRAAR